MSVIDIKFQLWWGLADKKKRSNVFTWLADKNYDIFCLQETHSTQLDEAKWKKEWGGGFTFHMDAQIQGGVMIMYKKKVDISVKETIIKM